VKDSPDYRRAQLAYHVLQNELVAQGSTASVYGFENLPASQREAWVAAASAIARDVLQADAPMPREAGDGRG
jgi:hypothetical protein